MRKTMTHTPGPWTWWTSNSWRRLQHDDRGISTHILYPCVHKDGQVDIDVSQADMALIAAAPDLLAALQDLLPRFVSCKRAHGCGEEFLSIATADFRAAIAKATKRER